MATPVYRNREVLFHTAFWAVCLSFIIYHISSYQRGPTIHWGRVLLGAMISVGYVFILSYLNYFYLIPAFLIRKKIGRFIIAFAVCFGLLTFLRFELEGLAIGFPGGAGRNPMSMQVVVEGTISDLFIVAFVGMLRFASDWLELDSQRRELETEKLSAELKFLKAQVNPHFFFNTLNNLYYLATIKSDNTPLVISKLSEVMRYLIYDSNHEKVELAKEIEYMQHYISLERLRLQEGVELDFEIAGRTDMLIAPLILITFLENAFKHGASNSQDQGWIRARVEVDENRLVYRIENSKPQNSINGVKREGIGLINVKRRLDLSYPGRYQLDIEDGETAFSVVLTIDLQ
ncbi:MAG TPA: histidine kinase [Puia sp.]|nr:histidine kinase [Puia sp.]